MKIHLLDDDKMQTLRERFAQNPKYLEAFDIVLREAWSETELDTRESVWDRGSVVDPPKYAVFKFEDVRAVTDGEDNEAGVIVLETVDVALIPDAVVIRHQDIFAAPALAEYSGQIRTFIDSVNVMVENGMIVDTGAVAEILAGLEAKADYFHDQSVEAYSADVRKLPT